MTGARGVDLYDRYQDVTNWPAVAAAGYAFAYVKGTDGGGPAVVRADAFVRGAKAAGMLVGLYHYAQTAPSPEVQADVLHAEVQRLGATGMPPVLDCEGPMKQVPLATAVDFSKRFLRRLQQHGYPRVGFYADSGFASKLRPAQWGISGLWPLWIADYGPNDGVRHPDLSPYVDRADIHQFTDRGRAPGVSGYVDLNWAFSTILADALEGIDPMTMTTDQMHQLGEIVAEHVWNFPCRFTSPSNREYAETRPAAEAVGDTMFWTSDLYKGLGTGDRAVLDELRKLAAADRDGDQPLTGEDAQRFTAAVLALLPETVHDAVREGFARAGADPAPDPAPAPGPAAG